MKFNKITTAIFVMLIAVLSIVGWAKQEKVLRIFSGGEIIQEYNADEIDYVEVQDLITAPDNVTATASESSITIKWSAVEGATYNVYRSPDNVSFTEIAKDLTVTTYTDEKPLQGSNYYRIKAIIDGVESGFTASATAALPDNGLESGVYLGINGFNKAIYRYPILYLNESSLAGFNGFIDGLSMEAGTILYYSVDEAINTLQATPLPSDISTVAIVTFTDGLDQGSLMKNKEYETDIEYLEAVNKRIKSETVAGQELQAFSIGLRGDDVSDYGMFNENLKKLASKDENAKEVTNISEVNAKFEEIAKTLSESNYVQTVNLKLPGISNGAKIRFTFDNVKDANNSELYIEGKFNLRETSLEEIEYHGMKCESGTKLIGKVEDDDIFVSFTFDKIRTDNNVIIKKEFIHEWEFKTASSKWQINSEFKNESDADVEVNRSSAVVMLVLDCSSSLGDQFTKVLDNAKSFVKTLFEASGFSITNPENPENPVNPETTIYSTKPLDLSVAVWKDNTRYYLTVDQYNKANLTGYNVEGLTVLSNMGNFIISPSLLNYNSVYKDYATKYYSDVLPDKDQATVISARYSDINKVLKSLSWSQFYSSSGDYYMTKTSYNSSYNYQIYLYTYTGGNLAGSNYNSYYGFIRGVKAIENKEIIWSDSRDLKLAVKKDGQRFFISDSSEDLTQFDEVEGIAVVLGDQQFIIKLKNEQSGSITKDAAMSLYSDILPDISQARVISMKYSGINSALSKFGGVPFGSTSSDYYMTKTPYNSSYNYQIYLYTYTGGNLASSNYNSGYGLIRGVVAIEDEVEPGVEVTPIETSVFDVVNATEIVGKTVEETYKADGSVQVAKHVQPLESLKLGVFDFSFDSNDNTTYAPAYYWPTSTNTVGKYSIRLYSGNTMTVTAPVGYVFNRIAAVSDSSFEPFIIYEGPAVNSYTFQASATTRINVIEVDYSSVNENSK